MIGVYVVLLVLSHGFQMWTGGVDHLLLPGPDRPSIQVSNRDSRGEPIGDQQLDVVYDKWETETTRTKTPALLMHGAPGMGTDFRRIGSLLGSEGRAIFAPDLVGFSASDMGTNVSYRVQARYMFDFLDQMGVDRVHLVGWSNGGGVGLRMADIDPERVASLTMLASVGAQETEGSGSFLFEHIKYAVGLGIAGTVPDLIPHFGLLGSRDLRIGWLWSFWDSDQRELTRIMPTIQTPVMILHGRDDPLVAASGAEHHHAMMPTSKLVMLDASHFMPFLQAEETAGYLNEFFDRHDEPGVEPITGYLDLAPVPTRYGADAALHWAGRMVQSAPWWVQLIVIVILTGRLPHVGIVVAMIFVVMMKIDLAVAILGLMTGRVWWMVCGANPLDRPHGWWRWMRGTLFVVPACMIGMIGASWVVALTESIGVVGLVGGGWLSLVGIHALRLFITWEGRQRIRAAIDRTFHHEYWPTFFLYIPVLSWGLGRVFSGKGLGKMTAVNPGYADDAGVQDESKMDLNLKLGDGTADDDSVLHCVLIDENENVRARISATDELIDHDQALGGLPVICKPDRGERGRAVRLELTKEGVADYCRQNPEPFVMQKYHPGPLELGVLWVRHVESITDPDYDGPSGFIYAITLKHFPTIIGDGRHTLRKLILMHPRYRAQAAVFIQKLERQLDLIPEEGEEVSLGFAGNHAQGAMFTDGEHLITPQLSERLCSIANRFNADQGGGFDLGRFDIRCESLDQLRMGEGFGIVELNGLTSEPTNIYDPDRSLMWAWGVLVGYWKHAERLAQARLDTKTGEPIDEKAWGRMKRALVRVMIG